MKYTYEELEVGTSPETSKIIKRSDGAFIPLDPGNADYQQYLKSLEDSE